jgi:death-on-curing protein
MLYYLTINEVIDIYKVTIQYSGGGACGIRNLGQMESILAHIQNDEYYPTISEKICHIIFQVIKSHCFIDGNKRMGLALSAKFLINNGYVAILKKYITFMENIIYEVASGNISKDLLLEVISAILEGDEENESLKLKIINATQNLS